MKKQKKNMNTKENEITNVLCGGTVGRLTEAEQ
jgi:hypothetical protein